jgi:DNA-binding ferritin-like protein
MKTLKFNQFLNEGAIADNAYGQFFAGMLAIRTQAHLFHWQTKSYARHIAFGDFYDAYIALVDKLAEALMSKQERPVVGKAAIDLVDYSDEAVNLFLNEACDLFKGPGEQICGQDSELKNIVDEIIAEIDKLKYLLTLS